MGVLPARYESSRFPGKPLVPILGVPMILRTYEQVRPWCGVVDELFGSPAASAVASGRLGTRTV